MESIMRNSTTTGTAQAVVEVSKTHLLTTTNVLLSISLYLLTSIAISFYNAPVLPTNIPWVGYGSGWLASLLNTFAAFTQTKSWMQKGYAQYTKKNKPFILPGGIGSAAEIVIPRSEMRWMLDQPDNVLSSSAAHYDILIGEYNFVDTAMLGDPYHEHVVHKSIARNLNGLIPGMDRNAPGDVDLVLGRMIGTSTKRGEWTSINLLEFFMTLVPRTTNRMIIGEPVCRNEEYLNAVAAFMSDIIRGMFIFAVSPKIMHPLVGAVVGLIPRYHYWVSSKHSLPVINQRLIDIQQKEEGNAAYKDWKEPNDFITWTIKTARSETRADELQPSRIAKRIMPLNFAAIHTSAMTGHCAILDIFSADPDVLQSLREEAARIYAEEGNQWTKQGLARMYRMDSAFRESQRYSSFAQTFVHRKVVAKEGVTTRNGVYCAPGTTLVVPWVQLSEDNDLHENADKFDAFRYSRDREDYYALPAEERDKSDALKLLQTGQVTTSDKHLPFGHGRHAW